ncbi:hypothetical protein GCM10028822_08770 [Hymenobacter terrigena]
MKRSYPDFLAGAVCATLLPSLALAQAPILTGMIPAANSTEISPQLVSLNFSQPVTGAAGIRVFGSRSRGLLPGTVSGDGTAQLRFQPTGPYFGLDELVSVSVPATVRGAGTGGAATSGSVLQFRTRTGGLYTGLFIGNTSEPETSTTLTEPTLADTDNDGRFDLLLADTQNDQVRLYKSFTTSVLGPATLLSTGQRPASIAVGDMNGDGNLDLLTSANGTVNPGVTLALGTGQGTFGAAVPVALGAAPGQLRVGDVNADGNLDFVVTAVAALPANGLPAAVLAVRLGNGQGGFVAAPDVLVDLDASNLHLADFNNDGRLDCLVGSSGSGLLKTYLGNGQGGFALAASAPVPRTGRTDVGDLTGDGLLDVAMADNAGNAVRIYPGTGTGGFGPATVLAVTGPLAVHLTNVNSDGSLDVLATYNNPSIGAAGTALWTNSFSGGTFGSARLLANCAGSQLVAGPMGGWPGLAIVDNGVNGASPNIKLRLNQPVLATRPAAATLPATCYPNPAHGRVQVLLPSGTPSGLTSEVFNLLGQRVYRQQEAAQQPGATATLLVGNLPAGLYTLRLTAGALTNCQPLVLE